jgi:peroxiredoxin
MARHRDRFHAAAALCALLVTLVAMPGLAAAGETFKPFKLKTLDGSPRVLADVLGKATLVIFFYPTCKFCNAALPEAQKLHDTYRERGLSVVLINVLPDEERLIPAWQSAHGYSMPILLGGRSVQRDYRLTMTPTHYLIDSQGKVLSKRAGFKAGDERAIEQEVRQALAISATMTE